MHRLSRLVRPFLLAAIMAGATVCGASHAQESKLPACPEGEVVKRHECFGAWTFDSGIKYLGDWKSGKPDGQGTQTLPNGWRYEGEFRDGKRSGKGTINAPSGEKYVGEVSDDKRHGQGTQTFANGFKYVGEFRDGRRNGRGTIDYPDGGKYVGELRDDKRHGEGTLTYNTGRRYVGQFKDGDLNQGTLYDPSGAVIHKGLWANNQPVQPVNVKPSDPGNARPVPPITATPAPNAPKTKSGTAFRVANGQFVTNHHVVDGCATIKIDSNSGGRVLASDQLNDMALISMANDRGETARIRTTRIQLNETVTVAGFPLEGVFTGITITNGTISRLSGFKGDTSTLQISAPVQQGNSGGPVLDASGNVIGVVKSKLNALLMAGASGDIPQNVNFAVSGNALRAFLDAKSVNYKEVGNEPERTGVQIAVRATAFTVLVECR